MKFKKGFTPWNKGIKTGIKPWLGKKRSPETIAKQKASLTGRKMPEEQKLKISQSLKGRKKKPFSEEHKKKMSEVRKKLYSSGKIKPQKYWLGKKFSEKHINSLKNNHSKNPVKRGDESINWSGGTTINGGYRLIYSPNHPAKHKGTPYVQEHRLVMEKHIGRFLEQGETVHHINGIKTDNRIENLILFKTASEHIKHHLELRNKA